MLLGDYLPILLNAIVLHAAISDKTKILWQTAANRKISFHFTSLCIAQ